ncbi:sensor domain-containing diguanylate cyclase [Paenibacillus lentus]|uniref:Diguanylate cyclase n=1 Tax=Paenibacillus lentus TaxID=1338368 RepID=A0A3S8RUV2_9BACL|nr:diguanylate cyclase [Paenibacillus lentus]AZK46965.1 diguanylate cyclase [Paenibacillus lentus]
MAKQSRDDPMIEPIPNSSLSMLFEEASEHMSWLEQLDITEHDYLYIEPFIQKGYADWKQEVSELPEIGGARWFVANHQGAILEADMPILPLVAETLTASVQTLQCAVRSFEQHSCIAVPVFTRTKGQLFTIFGCVLGEGLDATVSTLLVKTNAHYFRACFYKRVEAWFVLDLLTIQKQAKREEHRRSILFQAVQKLHGKIDVDSILSEVFERIAGMYPDAKVELLMSQDHLSRDPRVKSLLLHGEQEHVCVRAFMEGRMLRKELEGAEGEPFLEIGVPLIGKQGVYGVFHLLLPQDQVEEVDLQLISMLADTAGTAFENAKLYEQSNLLISELRLINELTKRLNQSLRPKEVFKFATEELLSIFKAEYCCISQIAKENEHFEVMSSNVPSLSQKEFFPKDYGFSGLVYSTQEPIILSDYKAYGKFASKLMEDTDSRSLIAAPLIVRGEVNGVIMLSHREERFFSYENYKLLQVLASHIGLAIANASLHAEVRRMANRDMLTGLYARHYLDDTIQEFQKKDNNGSLIIVDIDQFKGVNDTYGHQTGDQILKQVCSVITGTIRKTDIAARWGGEELALYLPGASIEHGHQIAEMIRLRVEQETEPRVTVSCGIAEWNRDDEKISVESLFYQADMALYKAKNNGRNQTQIG